VEGDGKTQNLCSSTSTGAILTKSRPCHFYKGLKAAGAKKAAAKKSVKKIAKKSVKKIAKKGKRKIAIKCPKKGNRWVWGKYRRMRSPIPPAYLRTLQ